jgi:hypothetical protein
VGTEFKYPQKKGGNIYVRSIRSRKYRDYFQLVESYRDKESGTVKKRVLVHLGEHATKEAALETWSGEIAEHRDAGRTEQAGNLQGKLDRLKAMV